MSILIWKWLEPNPDPALRSDNARWRIILISLGCLALNVFGVCYALDYGFCALRGAIFSFCSEYLYWSSNPEHFSWVTDIFKWLSWFQFQLISSNLSRVHWFQMILFTGWVVYLSLILEPVMADNAWLISNHMIHTSTSKTKEMRWITILRGRNWPGFGCSFKQFVEDSYYESVVHLVCTFTGAMDDICIRFIATSHQFKHRQV